jgi:hypothetical protein
MDSGNNAIINDEVASILGITTANLPVVVANTPAPLPPILFRPPTPPVPVRSDQPTQAENDAEYARDNLYDVIQKTSTLIDEMMPVATQSQAPRAYEVINSLLNTQKETAALLLRLQSDRAKLKVSGGGVIPTQGNVHIANAIFVGTNAQLLELMKGKNKQQEELIRDAEFLVDTEDDTAAN